LGQRPLGAILHSSNEPGELSQWLYHDDSSINIVLVIIIIMKKLAMPTLLLHSDPSPNAASADILVSNIKYVQILIQYPDQLWHQTTAVVNQTDHHLTAGGTACQK